MARNFNACQKANWQFFKMIRVSEKKEFNMKSGQRVQCMRREVLMGVKKIMVSWILWIGTRILKEPAAHIFRVSRIKFIR
jgi:hypothetical protein